MGTRVTHVPSLEGQTRIAEALEQQNKIMAMIVGNTASQPQTFADIKRIVRSGLAKSFFNVGDQVVTTYAIENGATYQAPWDVKHIDSSGVYLGMHYELPNAMRFDAPEAIYYTPNGLAAGTYNITIGAAHGTGWTVGKHIMFTLAHAVPAGGQIFIDFGQSNENDPTSGRTVKTYGTIGGSEAIDTTTTSTGSSGTNLGTIGADGNAQKTNGNLNAISRCIYGSGRYSESIVRQWLNSDSANSWWAPQNNWDRPPSEAELGNAGFLTRLPADFVAILDASDVTVALTTQESFAVNYETVHDRIFLPSLQNMYINTQLADVEGPDWDYYKTLAKGSGLPGKFQTQSTYNALQNYSTPSASGILYPGSFFLRSANRNTASSAWSVSSAGKIATSNVISSFRYCPACKIKTSE